MDGIYTDNSSSFAMQASGRDISLNVNGYKILSANADLSINNLILNGKIFKGNFYGSRFEADFKTFKLGPSWHFDVNGTCRAFSSPCLESSGFNLQDLASEGFHETNFYFSSPLKKNFLY